MFDKLNKFISFIGKDKIVHFTVSLVLVFVIYVVGSLCGLGVAATIPAFFLSMGFGVAKEFYDRKHGGCFDHYDIVSDFIGCFLAIVLISLMLI